LDQEKKKKRKKRSKAVQRKKTVTLGPQKKKRARNIAGCFQRKKNGLKKPESKPQRERVDVVKDVKVMTEEGRGETTSSPSGKNFGEHQGGEKPIKSSPIPERGLKRKKSHAKTKGQSPHSRKKNP